MSVQQQVGEKIRMYRKLRRMSLEDLASQIHKSKSILSKYELGESVFDMDTMYQIAAALDIEPAQLLAPQAKTVASASRYGIFQNNFLYTYMLVKDRSYHLLKSLLTINGTPDCGVEFYMQVPDFTRYTECKVLYTGQIFCHPNSVLIHLTNQQDPTDYGVFGAAVRMGKTDACIGLMMMSAYSTRDPGALKTIMTTAPVENEEELVCLLMINRDDIASTRRSNIFGYRLSSIDQELFR